MGEKALRRTRRDHTLWNRVVNDRFDGDPVLSGEESIAAAKKLYRHAMGKSWKGEWALTSGRRQTWPRWRKKGKRHVHVFFVNPDERRSSGRGLREIIHSISHYCHQQLHPYDKPHSIRQARLEAKLAKFAVERGCWMDGSLKKPEKPVVEKPDIIQQRYQRMVRRRDKYAKELERMKRLSVKAEREVKAYERRHGQRLVLAN